MTLGNENPLNEDDDKNKKSNAGDGANVNPESQSEKFENKLSDDEIVDRTIDIFQILSGTEDLVKKDQERKQEAKREAIELHSGEIKTIEAYSLTDFAQPYVAFFGKDVPFFKEMFRIADIDHKHDPDDFNKPGIAGALINEFIYRRFGKAIIAVLRAKAIPSGNRRYKFSQFLDADSKVKIRQFRDEAIAVMKKYGRGQLYEMRREYARMYKVEGFQYRLDI
jgi:hypothetical protein